MFERGREPWIEGGPGIALEPVGITGFLGEREFRVTLGRALIAIAVLLTAAHAAIQAAPAQLCSRSMPVQAGGATLELRYCADFDLLGAPRTQRRAVIALHGTDRNAVDYLRYVQDAADLAGERSRTLLVAPQFVTEEELRAYNLSPQTAYWSDSGWKQGNRSLDDPAFPRQGRVSSFAALEQLIERLQQVAPDLDTVVIAGHSAGGQFVQRFAAGNDLDGNPDTVGIHYLVANPSSYLYFSDERLDRDLDQFIVPVSTGCRTWYNDYKYGLDELNSYMAAAGAGTIAQRYPGRRVAYLLGADDDDPNSSSLDTSCAAQHQGRHRRERGEIFARHLRDRFGVVEVGGHETSVIPGVGHSGRRMLQSDCALYYQFGRSDLAGACNGLQATEPPGAPAGLNAR